MRLMTLLVVFLLFGAFFIISEKKLYITNRDDLSALKTGYAEWLFSAFKGAVGFAGQAVRMEWLPDVKTEKIVSNETKDVNSSNISNKS